MSIVDEMFRLVKKFKIKKCFTTPILMTIENIVSGKYDNDWLLIPLIKRI